MNEKAIRDYETKCLFELLAAIIAQRPSPEWVKKPDIQFLFRIADFQNVSNIAYYGLFGLEIKKGAIWKKRFEERYRKAVISYDRYEALIPSLLDVLEARKIHNVVIDDYTMCEYFPKADMCDIKNVRILIDKNKMNEVHNALIRMDFEEKESEIKSERIYYKIPGIYVIIQSEINFTNKKMKKYFDLPIKDYPLYENTTYIHTFMPEQYYIYLLACAAENFANGLFDIKNMVNIWAYYVKAYEGLNFSIINKELTFLGIDKFHKTLLKLASYWFTGEQFPENDKLFVEFENFILSKGTKGYTLMQEVLPLMKEVARKNKRINRKRKRRTAKQWAFPSLEYMVKMYPELEKKPQLLLFYQLKRLSKIGLREANSNVKKIMRVTKGEVLKNAVTHRENTMFLISKIKNANKKKYSIATVAEKVADEAPVIVEKDAQNAEIIENNNPE